MQVYRMPAVPLSWGPGFQVAVEFVDASPNQSNMIALQSSPYSGGRNEGVKDSFFVSPCDHYSTQVLVLDDSCLLNVSVAKRGLRPCSRLQQAYRVFFWSKWPLGETDMRQTLSNRPLTVPIRKKLF
jgi:hypothetical protein